MDVLSKFQPYSMDYRGLYFVQTRKNQPNNDWQKPVWSFPLA